MKPIRTLISAVFVLTTAWSCVSIEDIAMKSAADMLSSDSGGAAVFTMDDDPQLIADALPLALKMYEMVLASNPGHAALNAATGRTFVMYANAFIQTPAGMLPDGEWARQDAMLRRAGKMYMRGRDYILNGIELEHPGFTAAVGEDRLGEALSMADAPEDAGNLYWAASAWIGAYSCDPFNFELANSLYIPAAMLLRALELDEGYNKGAIHDVFIQIYSSLPYSHILKAAGAAPEVTGRFNSEYYEEAGTGDSGEQKTEYHFNRAVELAGGKNPGTYCSYASAVSVKKQDYAEYKQLLETALTIDAAEIPENELIVTIYQDKARWMLEHAEDFFISIEE